MAVITADVVLAHVAQAAPLPNLVLTCPDAGAIGRAGVDGCRGYVYQVPTYERIVLAGSLTSSSWRRLGELAPSDLVLVCTLPVEPGLYSSCRDGSGVRRTQFVPKGTLLPEPPPPSGGARIIDLSSAPFVIAEPGVYVFDRSWTEVRVVGGAPPTGAIVITANDVTLDLQGFELSSPDETPINSIASNVMIRNGRVSAYHGTAIVASGRDTRIENVRVRVTITGVAVNLSGSGSVLVDSSLAVSEGASVVAGDDTTVRDNRISSGERGIRAASRTRIVGNSLSCSPRVSCVEVEGNGNLLTGNVFTSNAMLAIRGNYNQALNNVFLRTPCPSGTGATVDTAVRVDGRGNTIRGSLIPLCPDGFPGWLAGIVFTQDGNFYGDNTVWATVPFDLGATVQVDLGGNEGFDR